MKLAISAALTVLFLGLVFSCQSTNPATAAKETSPAPAPVQSNAKLCALTFDDGPDGIMTPKVLDKLEKYKVKATFFWIGQKINDSAKPAIDRIVAMGCEVGNHSYGYSSLNKLSPEAIKDSVGRTSALIKQYTGKEPAFFRPPNLAVSAAMYENIPMFFAEGVLAFDWQGTNTTAETRAQNVLNGVRDGAIILMHDVQPQPHPTPEALDIIIPELQKQGYEFVTLSELFKRKGVKYDPNATRMWKYVN